jgi:S-adenosylmethionine:tRNA ribosyltransferase-isomerase
MLQALLKGKRRIAIGTTSTRSLESIYWLGVKALISPDFSFNNLFLDQWEAYDLDDSISLEEAINVLLEKMHMNGLADFSFQTRIMITPGYKIRVTDGLFTNFHQPKSTLLLLIAALVGDEWKSIYTYALENDYRFLSYGDSSLIFV